MPRYHYPKPDALDLEFVAQFGPNIWPDFNYGHDDEPGIPEPAPEVLAMTGPQVTAAMHADGFRFTSERYWEKRPAGPLRQLVMKPIRRRRARKVMKRVLQAFDG